MIEMRRSVLRADPVEFAGRQVGVTGEEYRLQLHGVRFGFGAIYRRPVAVEVHGWAPIRIRDHVMEAWMAAFAIALVARLIRRFIT